MADEKEREFTGWYFSCTGGHFHREMDPEWDKREPKGKYYRLPDFTELAMRFKKHFPENAECVLFIPSYARGAHKRYLAGEPAIATR